MAGLALNEVDEKEALTLLVNYRQIVSFEEALEKFKDNYYDDYRVDIHNATKGTALAGGAGVQTFDEAYQLLVDTKFIANKTTYKKVGLITGIDPEYWPEFRRDPNKLPSKFSEKIKDWFDSSNTFDILYEPGQKVQKSGLTWMNASSWGAIATDEAILFQNSISQYFLDLGIYINKRGTPSNSGDLYLNFLRGSIFGLLKQMLAAWPNADFSESEASIRGQSAVGDAKADIQKRIQQIDSHMDGVLSSQEIEKYESSILYFRDNERGARYLLNLVKQAIEGTGQFGELFSQTAAVLSTIYLDRKTVISNRLGVSVNPVVLRERQLQDILAFFGAADPRLESDTPEASVPSLTQAPESVNTAIEPPKLTPFDFQCFLLENISRLVEQRNNPAYSANYTNIVKIMTDGDPASIINTIQHGGKDSEKADSVRALLDICPEVHGLLTPYLKISRLDYDDLGNILIDEQTGLSTMSDLKISNFLTQDNIEQILSSDSGRAAGAGIKSFTWSLDGVQPEEVDNNIKATLVMYFQSVNDFFNGASQAGQETANFLDLIINSPAVKKLTSKKSENKDPQTPSCDSDSLRTEAHREYDGANFRVKICAGWSTPPVEAIRELVGDATKAKNLIKAIDDSKISLFLQMVEHQINFNQNGSLELTVQYQASLSGLLTGKTANIFDETRGKILVQEMGVAEGKLEDLNAEDKKNDGLTDPQKEQKKESLEEIRELKNIGRNIKYRKLLKKVYSSNKIHNISLNPSELTLPPFGDLTPEQRQRRVKRKLSKETFEFKSVDALNEELIYALGRNLSKTGTAVDKDAEAATKKRLATLAMNKRINIPFFYLGDLFDMVLEEVREYNKGQPLNFNFFMSDVEMIDPLQAFKLSNLEELIDCGYDLRDIMLLDSINKINPGPPNTSGVYKTMNIGDIPISLDAFQLWFKNNVIKKDRDNYFFLYFVKDICGGLITKVLSHHCFGEEFNFEQRFDTQPLTFSKVAGGENKGNADERWNVKTISPTDLAQAQASATCGIDPTNVDYGLLLYPTDSSPRNLKGFFELDLERGIYHHYLGSSCGLVKQINFQRFDQQYLRESRIQKKGALGAEQLRELYSANIELVGNTLYKNGMYIYINPSLLNADRASLDYLGLHGYYLVTKVSSKVTPKGFDVSISALHQGIEFGGDTLLASEVVDLGSYDAVEPEGNPLENRPYMGVEEKIARATLEVGGLQAITEALARGDINQAQAGFRTAELAAKTAASTVGQNVYNWFKEF